MVKFDLKSLMSNPQRSIQFERLSTCPFCVEHNREKWKHSPYWCLAASISSYLADEPIGIQGSKIPAKVITMIGEINRKRLLVSLPPIMIEEDSSFYDYNMSSDPGFHD